MSYGICYSFPAEILSGVHDFSTDVFKMALYTSALSQSVTAYSATDEVSGAGYSAGGATVSFTIGTSANITSISLADETMDTPEAAVSFLIYNSSKSNKAVFVAPLGDGVSGSGSLTATWNIPVFSITV